MAKTKASTDSIKQTFGKKKGGKHKRKFGPKGKKPKSYRGQGR
jgi:hypothetical protein